MLQACHHSEWFALSFDLNIFFMEVITSVIARGIGDPINQSDWTSYTLVFPTLRRRRSPQRRPHINKYAFYTHTHTLRLAYKSCSSDLHHQMTDSLSFPEWTVLSGMSMNFPFFSSLSDVQLLLSTPSYSKQFIATYWQLRPL